MSETGRSDDVGAGVTRPAHGIADWPFGTNAWRDARPDTLPDGRPWPRVLVVTVADVGTDELTATAASVTAQGYPEARHDIIAASDHGAGSLSRAGEGQGPALLGQGATSSFAGDGLRDPDADTPSSRAKRSNPEAQREGRIAGEGSGTGLLRFARNDGRGVAPTPREFVPAMGRTDEEDLRAERDFLADAEYVFFLRPGDMLAPGALTALCLEAALSGAQAVAGVRVLFDASGVCALDAPGDPAAQPGAPAFTGGEILVSRAAIDAAGGIAPNTALPLAALWPRLVAAGLRLARIGRPVLLQRVPDGSIDPPAPGLRIAALSDLGERGGAGIAHRRLTEALGLCGHRVTHLRLADESPPAAAEWTDAFPQTEAALRDHHDLVLSGNLHGTTRSTALLGRLAQTMPVAAVLHDLFAVTGRCAHPKDCAVIATGCDLRCPSPDEFPQLAPHRIAGVYAKKQAVLEAPRAPLLLANSDWTAEQARALGPPGTKVARITLPFPTGVFRPGDRAALREKLGLPQGDVLVLFSAVIADAPDKGFSELVETLRAVARPGIGFVALGRLDDPRAFGVPNLYAPGPIADESRLAEWYGACDICLTASRLETLGQTPIEAGLCGVPSVAFRATGLTSAVLDGVTGVLVEPRPGALAEALAALIDDEPRRRRLGGFARIILESRFSHAAAALSLHDAFVTWDAMSSRENAARIRFAPEMLGRFAFAAERHPGATGTVAAPSPAPVRALRRVKHAVLGRGMPLWLRYALYAASRLRRARGLRA